MKLQWKTKALATLTALVMGATATVSSTTAMLTAEDTAVETSAASSSDYDYGEALQKSMFFYQAQMSGVLPEWNVVSWRSDSMTTDFVTGGWFDAGDHLKFTLTNAYSAILLGWGLYQYGTGVEEIGEMTEYQNTLEWGLDYLVNCDLGDEIVYMIGDGAFDHVWWGSAEVYMEKYAYMGNGTERPYYTCNNSCIEAQMAAALAIGYLCFKDTDSVKAEVYLEHALDLFSRADTYRAIGGDEAETSYYNISDFWDDLFLAANWLYVATGDQAYLDVCEDYIPNLGTESQSTEVKYTWGFCWDDTLQGAILMYAINTGDSTWKTQVYKHLEYWTTGYGGKQVTYTPDGLAWLTTWGSLRHATATAFLAYVAADELFYDDSTLFTKYTEFADSQMNYCFGDNANNYSYVVGMGETYPQAYHHRTSSGVWDDQWTTIGQEDGKEHAHILYGALVGGPDSNGTFTDSISQYQYTEVAIDYNAGYTAALCAMVTKYGGTTDEDFPEEETPKWTEFYVEACINQSSSNYTEIKIQATNHSAWPARLAHQLSVNYYFDLSELFEAGYTTDDLRLTVGYTEYSVELTGPFQYEDTIYYVTITFEENAQIMPTGQSENQAEVQFRIAAPDATSFWDASNDYSYAGLVMQDVAVTEYITMYDDGVLIWGTEPDGTTPDDVEASEDTNGGTQSDLLYGDVTLNGIVDINDVVALMQGIAGVVILSDEQLVVADVDGVAGVVFDDGLVILRYLAGLYDSLPLT